MQVTKVQPQKGMLIATESFSQLGVRSK